jgi:glycosyltransferase involved in cell wall biosynthesis
MQANISAIIIAKNEQEMIEAALKSLDFVEEIIVIDNDSSDNTVSIAKKYKAKVFYCDADRFDALRDKGLKKAKQDWVLYLDADERISDSLKREIIKVTKSSKFSAYFIKRKNYFLGTRMYDDQVQRLFQRDFLKRWQGQVHETPVYKGETGTLKNYLDHYTHRDIASMLEKTNRWSEIEAKLRFDAHHPPIKVWRIFRIMITEGFNQFAKKKVYKYGLAGWIEGMFQIIDKMIVYIKLWELQQK